MEMHSVPERKKSIFWKSLGSLRALLPCSFRIVLRIFVQFSYLFIFFISFKLNSNFENLVF